MTRVHFAGDCVGQDGGRRAAGQVVHAAAHNGQCHIVQHPRVLPRHTLSCHMSRVTCHVSHVTRHTPCTAGASQHHCAVQRRPPRHRRRLLLLLRQRCSGQRVALRSEQARAQPCTCVRRVPCTPKAHKPFSHTKAQVMCRMRVCPCTPSFSLQRGGMTCKCATRRLQPSTRRNTAVRLCNNCSTCAAVMRGVIRP